MSFANDDLGTTLDLAPICLSDVEFSATLGYEMDEIKFIFEATQTPSPRFELHDHAMSIETDLTPMTSYHDFLISTINMRTAGGYSHNHQPTAQLYAQLQSTSAADKWAQPRLVGIEYLVRCLGGRATWHAGVFSAKHALKHNCLHRSLLRATQALDLLCAAFSVKNHVIALTETVLAEHKIVLAYRATIRVDDLPAAKTVLSINFFKRLKELKVARGTSFALTATITCWYLNGCEIHAVDLDADVAAL
ncbi:hypothetical protein SDRG_16938 [Saprolegnia diclina VS20]|uniref:Uncharacterized protein n=1 Tax=Saprolegnia diclina (strain VS20) TaxID=1156394 RepID=T0R6Q8_SAPDV|nr:hypothetical protein SDRG_16938 [Saprolegnia diclina VS20]EQC25187.1 hypothetical protein SDRG_16938 [Saprolegnia diclina VS20]|eukprot:XP_008621386.1 hypothetical protein SDRG_16938 [Saprolegnia diclina VS20]